MKRDLLYRLLCGLIGWGTVGLIYQFSADFHTQANLLTPSWIDNAIPYSVQGIWFYLSFFLFIPFGYLLCPRQSVLKLMVAMQLCALFSGSVYLLYPTTMSYPINEGLDSASYLLSQLIAVDSPHNLLPSLHVSLTALALYALWSQQYKLRTGLFLLWAIMICFSVLQLRRHLFIDLITGVIVAVLSGYLSQLLVAKYLKWQGRASE
nr:phosphatase PAP2 family protein [uncultured Moellerella sp.]